MWYNIEYRTGIIVWYSRQHGTVNFSQEYKIYNKYRHFISLIFFQLVLCNMNSRFIRVLYLHKLNYIFKSFIIPLSFCFSGFW